jgi:iron complex outermembrane recepter protein
MTARRTLTFALLTSTMLVACPALAQIAPAADTASSGDEIIVTAQKREESLQNVPISIQALGGAKLDEHQVSSFDDYAKLLPSVSFQSFGPGQSQIYFRGVTSGGDGQHNGSQPTSALYLDEIPLTTVAGSVDVHVYDIARVEALSGPQGTLFGSSSLAGTLRIITNKPSTAGFAGGIDVQGNKFGKGGYGGSVEGFINLPLSSNIAFRASGFYQKDGGYIDNVPGTRTYTLADPDPTTNVTINNAKFVKNDFNDIETYGGRAALGIELDDNWTVTPALVYQHQRANGTFLFDPRVGDLKVNDYTPDRNVDEWYQASLTIQGKLSDWDVVYAGGYFDRRVDNTADYSEYTVAYDNYASNPYYTNFPTATGGFLDPTQTFHGNDKYSKQTHELRVSSPASDRFRLTAGLFYQRQTDTIIADYIIPGLAGIPNSPAVPKAGDDIFATRGFRVDRDYAAFGEASFDLLPSVTITGGIRGFIYNNTIQGFSGTAGSTTRPNCIAVIANDRICNNFNKKAVSSGQTHKINLTWRVDPAHLLYATYSTGYRPGGNNRTAGINPYKPDILTNYEIGFKTSWFDRHLTINGAAFIEEWKDLQYGLTAAGTLGVVSTYNAGNARIKGIEGDINWRIGGLTLSGSGTYIDAKLTTSFCPIGLNLNPDCSLGVAAPAGTRLPIQPRFKGTATARYAFDLGSASPFIQASVQHQSGTRSYLTTFEANLLGSTKAFTTVDFSVGATFGKFNIEAFIQNAFDERGQLSFNTVCIPTLCGAAARTYVVKPQLFGIKAGTKF